MKGQKLSCYLPQTHRCCTYVSLRTVELNDNVLENISDQFEILGIFSRKSLFIRYEMEFFTHFVV